MKCILGVVCLTACLAAASATLCKSENDCRKGFCCVALSSTQMMKRGLCLRMTKMKRQCSEPESKNDYFGGKYTRYCPCDEGMICMPYKEGITDPVTRINSLRCQKLTETTTGPDVTTASNIVTDGEIVDTTRGEIVTDGDNIVTEPTIPEVVTDDDNTLPPEIVTEETEAPEEVVETEAPEEVVETEAPPEEVVEETEAPPEEVVEETEAPPEEVVEETEAPPEEDVVGEAGQRGPGGERPREDDPDCEDWTYGC